VSFKMNMEHACCLCGRARARAHAGIW
jgi:hypothetical protein